MDNMDYSFYAYEGLLAFCESVFRAYGFTEEESRQIADVILAADLNGIESRSCSTAPRL